MDPEPPKEDSSISKQPPKQKTISKDKRNDSFSGDEHSKVVSSSSQIVSKKKSKKRNKLLKKTKSTVDSDNDDVEKSAASSQMSNENSEKSQVFSRLANIANVAANIQVVDEGEKQQNIQEIILEEQQNIQQQIIPVQEINVQDQDVQEVVVQQQVERTPSSQNQQQSPQLQPISQNYRESVIQKRREVKANITKEQQDVDSEEERKSKSRERIRGSRSRSPKQQTKKHNTKTSTPRQGASTPTSQRSTTSKRFQSHAITHYDEDEMINLQKFRHQSEKQNISNENNSQNNERENYPQNFFQNNLHLDLKNQQLAVADANKNLESLENQQPTNAGGNSLEQSNPIPLDNSHFQGNIQQGQIQIEQIKQQIQETIQLENIQGNLQQAHIQQAPDENIGERVSKKIKVSTADKSTNDNDNSKKQPPTPLSVVLPVAEEIIQEEEKQQKSRQKSQSKKLEMFQQNNLTTQPNEKKTQKNQLNQSPLVYYESDKQDQYSDLSSPPTFMDVESDNQVEDEQIKNQKRLIKLEKQTKEAIEFQSQLDKVFFKQKIEQNKPEQQNQSQNNSQSNNQNQNQNQLNKQNQSNQQNQQNQNKKQLIAASINEHKKKYFNDDKSVFSQAYKEYSLKQLKHAKEINDFSSIQLLKFRETYTQTLTQECSFYSQLVESLIPVFQLHSEKYKHYVTQDLTVKQSQQFFKQLVINQFPKLPGSAYTKETDITAYPIISKLHKGLQKEVLVGQGNNQGDSLNSINLSQIVNDNLIENLISRNIVTEEEITYFQEMPVPFDRISKINKNSSHSNSPLLKLMEEMINVQFLQSHVVRVTNPHNIQTNEKGEIDEASIVYHHFVSRSLSDYSNYFQYSKNKNSTVNQSTRTENPSAFCTFKNIYQNIFQEHLLKIFQEHQRTFIKTF